MRGNDCARVRSGRLRILGCGACMVAGFGSCQTDTTDTGSSLGSWARRSFALTAPGTSLYRINVGGPGLASGDSGPAWQSDEAGSGGASPFRSQGGDAVYATSDSIGVPADFPAEVPAQLFQTERWDSPAGSNMLWSFPVEEGTFVELRLYFAETFFESDETQRSFDVSVDGQINPHLSQIDVFADVGHDVASVRRLQLTSDGTVDLEFLHAAQNPMLKGIEIVEINPVQYRVNAGGPELTAADGSLPSWSADTQTSPSPQLSIGSCATCNTTYATPDSVLMPDVVGAAAPMSLFQTERWDHGALPEMSWSFEVDAGRPAEVRLFFAETYIDASNAASVGSRTFSVAVDGSVPNAFEAIDIYAEAGDDHAVMKSTQLVSDGQIDLEFFHDAQNPMLKGVEVVLVDGAITTDQTTGPVSPSFQSPADLADVSLTNPTTLQFGPDGRLYVGEKQGSIKALSVQRDGVGAYSVANVEVIDAVAQIPNRDDDTGNVNASVSARQVTGLLVAGSASNPILFVTSSDPRIGAGGGGTDLNLDTNSGILSRLTWTGGQWQHEQLVRGLPRSEENHASNGMALDASTNTLYLAQGGHTNAGSPSNNFALSTEYALAAAILAIDLDALDALPLQTDEQGMAYRYDLPTLDDPNRPNANGITSPSQPGYDGVDVADPFGGDDGMNQAKIVVGGPVRVHASGFRNAYDVVLTASGDMYSVDNGANAGWGGHPVGEGAYPGGQAGACTNQYDASEPGSNGAGPNDPQVNNKNGLHHVRVLQPGDVNYPGQAERYYAGHPAPLRGNPQFAGFFYDGQYLAPGDGALPVDWPPVPPSEAHPAECDFRNSGETDGALANYAASTNGLTEYTASNFGGAMQGDLLLAAFSGHIYRVQLDESGSVAENCPAPPTNCNASFASGFGSLPLDVVAMGDDAPFPGTVWVAVFGSHKITVFEPIDFEGNVGVTCTPTNPSDDSDGDGYSNADEAQNGTDPCSAASSPEDHDGDGLSDLLDEDDDDDGLPDVMDPFARDADNGTATSLPVAYEFFNADPGFGFFGLGFTGLMTNGVDDYLTQYDANEIVAGGTAGLLTVPVTAGDAYSGLNEQDGGFQFGVDVSTGTGLFTAHTKINAPFFGGQAPENFQAQGLVIGTGDQSNYLKLVLSAARGIEVLLESDDAVTNKAVYPESNANLLGASEISLYLTVDPNAGTVQPAYLVPGSGLQEIGGALSLAGDLLQAVRGDYAVGGQSSALAVGIVSTSVGSGTAFSATWDFLRVDGGSPQSDGTL